MLKLRSTRERFRFIDIASEQVCKLPAGHFLMLDHDGKEAIAPYWRLNYCDKTRASYEEAVESLDSLLGAAVKTSLDSDHPVALTLSGGVDSSLLLAYACGAGAGIPPACYTLGAHHADEEFQRAHSVAQQFGAAIDRFAVPETTYGAVVQALGRFDEPVNVYDSIYLLQHSRHIAAQHRVAMTGNGADEAFGGYASYLMWPVAGEDTASRTPDSRVLIEQFLSQVIASHADELFSPQLGNYCREYDASSHLAPMHAVACYDTAIDARLCYDLFAGMSHCASLGDAVGMVCALEYRSPFLRRSVLEFAATLPVDWKVCTRTGANKPILKTLAQRRIPGFTALTRKLGCGHHIDRYALMRQDWRRDIESALVDTRELTAPFLDFAKVSRLWSTFVSGRASPDTERRTLKLVLLAAWLEAHSNLF
jgi:asparagine synthase (glutamine-hydrolysing)